MTDTQDLTVSDTAAVPKKRGRKPKASAKSAAVETSAVTPAAPGVVQSVLTPAERLRRDIRAMVRGAYDIQKLRMQTGLRLCANFRSKLGQVPGTKTETLDEEDTSLIKDITDAYGRLSDALADKAVHRKSFVGNDLISSFTEFSLVGNYVALEEQERTAFKELSEVVKAHPLWRGFCEAVKGCGPTIAGVLISEIDISKARYPSSLWKLSGLDVAPDGMGRSRRKEHLVDRDYTDKDGKPAKRMGITFNAFLKTKLMGVLAPCLLKTAGDYSKIYADYKHRLVHHAVWGEARDGAKDGLHRTSKGRRHYMAMRYMVKRFLVDLYKAWRTMEGLPVAPEYSEAKLGMVHSREAVA